MWFLEAVKQTGFKLYENTINMLEAAIYHSGGDKQNSLSDQEIVIKSDGCTTQHSSQSSIAKDD